LTINENGIATASQLELLAIYIYDEDISELMGFDEWLCRCKALGVKVIG
jgi:hypothetical protein